MSVMYTPQRYPIHILRPHEHEDTPITQLPTVCRAAEWKRFHFMGKRFHFRG